MAANSRLEPRHGGKERQAVGRALRNGVLQSQRLEHAGLPLRRALTARLEIVRRETPEFSAISGMATVH